MSRADAELYIKQQQAFASEEGRADREAWAQKMCDINLQIATKYLHRKGVWRVRLNSSCEIVEVVSGVKGGPPVPGEFSFKTAADGEAPTFGSLARLDGAQTNYAKTLIDDLGKVARSRELAHQARVSCEADGILEQAEGLIENYLENFQQKAGELPKSATEVQEERRQQAAREEQQRMEQREADRRAALELLGDASLSSAIERDREKQRKKAQKKARQRAKRMAAGGEVEANGPAGDAAGSDGEAFFDANEEAETREEDVDDEVAAFAKRLGLA